MEDYKKKYKDALAKAREIHRNEDEKRRDMEWLFPELADSNDERIRKALVDALNKNLGNGIEKYGTTLNAALAWLEKQGDKDKLIKELGEYKVKYTQEVLSQQLEKQGKVDTVSYEVAEKEKKELKKIEEDGVENKKQIMSDMVDLVTAYVKQKSETAWSDEDEKIRKECISIINAWAEACRVEGDCCEVAPICIAWLEKQGDNNNQNWKPSKGQINALEHFVRSIGESGYASPYDENTKLLYSLLNDLCKLEKQDEQKPILDFKASNLYVSKVDGKIHDMTYNPANKVEPNFKLDDWIIFNGFIIHIDEVVNGYYRTTTFDGIPNSYSWDIDNVARLWTIQDTKKGDVLEFEDHERVVVGIVSFVNERTGKVDVSCLLEDNEFKIGNFYALDTIKPHPATKEQCNLLFTKMREAGYEWNAKKKELKKIEQKYTVEPIFSIGDVLCDKSCTTIDKNSQLNIEVRDIRNDMYICNNCSFPISQQDEYELVKKRIEPQLAWSEEDEGMKENIEGALDCYESMVSEDWEKEKEWLKRIKKRIGG